MKTDSRFPKYLNRAKENGMSPHFVFMFFRFGLESISGQSDVHVQFRFTGFLPENRISNIVTVYFIFIIKFSTYIFKMILDGSSLKAPCLGLGLGPELSLI